MPEILSMNAVLAGADIVSKETPPTIDGTILPPKAPEPWSINGERTYFSPSREMVKKHFH